MSYQINNYSTGEKVRITDFSMIKNLVTYKVLSPDNVQIKKGEYGPINSLSGYEGSEIIPLKIVCDALVLELFGEEWETSQDLQCWQKGVLEKNRRFFIPNWLVLKALGNKIEEYKDFKPTLDYMVAASDIDTDILIEYTDRVQIIYASSIDEAIAAPILARLSKTINADGTTTINNEDGVIIQEYKKI